MMHVAKKANSECKSLKEAFENGKRSEDASKARTFTFLEEDDAIDCPRDTLFSDHWDDPDVRVRVCSVCGYRGKWSSEMIRHKRVHTNERPFRCKICSRTSKWKADLIRHLNRIHSVRVLTKNTRNIVQFVEHVQEPPVLTAKETPPPMPHPEAADAGGDAPAKQSLPMIRLRIKVNGSDESGAPSVRIIKSEPAPTAAAVNGLDHDAPVELKARPAGVHGDSKLKAVLDKYAIVGSPTFGNNRWLRCRLCPYATWDRHTFRIHTQKHENKKLYQCSACGYRSNWSSDVHKHIRFKRSTHFTATVVKLTDSAARHSYGQDESDSSSVSSTEPGQAAPPNAVVQGDAVQPMRRDDLSTTTSTEQSTSAEHSDNEEPMDTDQEESYCVALDFEDVCEVVADFMDIINAAAEEQKSQGDQVEGFSMNELPALCNSNGQLLVRLNGSASEECVAHKRPTAQRQVTKFAVPVKRETSPPPVTIATSEQRLEIRKIEVNINGDRKKMWQCRYCSHVSKRRANVRMHEKKHFKVKHR